MISDDVNIESSKSKSLNINDKEFESSRLNKDDVANEKELFEELGLNNLESLEKINIDTEDYNKIIEEKDNRIRFLESKITDFYSQLNL